MWSTHTTVATVVEKDQQFLMVEELVEGKTVINQPAGHLEPGETLIEAAIRETLEETTWHVKIESFLGLYHYTSEATGICYIRSCFIGKPCHEVTDRELDSDIVQVHWMSIDEIRESQVQLRSPVVLQVLEDYFNGTTYPLSLITTL